MGDRRRENGGGGGRQFNDRKRRFHERADDEEMNDRRGPPPNRRRRFNDGRPPPPGTQLRSQLLGIAESGLRQPDEEVKQIAKLVTDNYEDNYVRELFCSLIVSLIAEQPLKIPFLAATVSTANIDRPELMQEVLRRVQEHAQKKINAGNWRDFKVALRFLACLQPMFEDEGVFPVLFALFDQAADLQTSSAEDSLGLELVKIILLTIPYLQTSGAEGIDSKVADLLERTDIIAAAPHALETLIDPYPANAKGDRTVECPKVITVLQKQLQEEAENGWPLAIMYRFAKHDSNTDGGEENGNGKPKESQKHPFPALNIPTPVNPGKVASFPELLISLYADQEIASVPPTSNLASIVIRDTVVDTIDLLDFNRTAAAKLLIELDCFWAPGTFAKRSTTFDKLKDIPEGDSTWKPEDMALDAIFSQIIKLPNPTHRLVYYHAVITETCKIAPGAIAPSLGRAIRFLFRHIGEMDLELGYRYMDWFAHHLSNFEFRWRWAEWQDVLTTSDLEPQKSFIIGAIDKEIRLSFAKRIRDALPEAYQSLITEGQMRETPTFKFKDDKTPYASQGRKVLDLLKDKRATEEDMQAVLTDVENLAEEQGVIDPLIVSTDVFVTAICEIGCKSLSHVLATIDKSKERLLAIGPVSEAARRQIITSVTEFWIDQPGTAVDIIDKLLNYTIVTPMSVIEWALQDHLDRGKSLSRNWIYELVASTMTKVSNRVRQIASARVDPNLPADQKDIVDETLARERQSMRELFQAVDDSVSGVAAGADDEMIEAYDDAEGESGLLQQWGERWMTVWRRKGAVEESVVGEAAVQERIELAVKNGEREAQEAEVAAEEARVEAVKAEESAAVEAKAKADRNGDAGLGANGGAMDEVDVDVDVA